jgi:hypothetical protein
MISRALFNLVERGYVFPRPGALTINREYRPPTFLPLRVRVLRRFYGRGRLLQAGEVVELIEPDARAAIAAGKATVA